MDDFRRACDQTLCAASSLGSACSGYTQLGSEPFAGQPTVVSWGSNRIDAFVRGTDNALWTKSWNGSAWSGYTQLGSQPIAGPLKGFVDLHTHPLSSLGFGGKLVYGGVDVGALLTADPDCHHNIRAQNMEQPLGHDNSTHCGVNICSNTCSYEIPNNVS